MIMELSVFYNLEVVKMKEKEIQYPDFVVRENIKVENYGYDNEKFRFLLTVPFKSNGNKFLRVIMKESINIV